MANHSSTDQAGAHSRMVPIASLLFALIVGFVALHHETWRDEADSWLAARDIGFSAMFTYTRYVGMPVLWLFVLAPFAKIGLPYETMQVIHWLLATAGVVVFLKYAPFSKLTRVLVVFSYPIAFEYAVVARNYVLIVLLLWIIAALFTVRLKRPIAFAIPVMLLFSAAVHSVMIAGAVALFFTIDVYRQGRERTRRQVLAVVLMAFGAVAAVVQLRPPVDGQMITRETAHPLAMEYVARQAIVQSMYLPEIWKVALVINVSVLGLAFVSLLVRPRAWLVLVMGGGWLAYIFLYKWIHLGGLRHPVLVFVLLIFALWIGRIEPAWTWKRRDGQSGALMTSARLASVVCIIVLNVGLVASCLASARALVGDYHYEYSHAKQAARYVRETQPRDRILAGPFYNESILVYLPEWEKFWYADLREWGTHNTWDANFSRNLNLDPTVYLIRAGRKFNYDPKLLVILFENLPDPERIGFRMIHRTVGLVGPSGEQFFFYEPIAGHPATLPVQTN